MTEYFLLSSRVFYRPMIAIIIFCTMMTMIVASLLAMTLCPIIRPQPPGLWPNVLAIETAIDTLRTSSPTTREAIARSMSTADTRFRTTAPFPCLPIQTEHVSVLLRRILKAQPNNRDAIITDSTCIVDPSGLTSTHIDMPQDRIFITVHNHINHQRSQCIRTTLPMIIMFLSLPVVMGSLLLWCLWRINRSLSLRTDNGQTFVHGIMSMPLVRHKPVAPHYISRAFHNMMLKISHDLHAPLTRLSMRIEIMGSPDAAPAALRNDLWLMNRILNGTLSFLKRQGDTEPTKQVDINSLVQEVCCTYRASNTHINYQGNSNLICICQSVAITRVVKTLIDNARTFSSQVQVRTFSDIHEAIIEVADHDPGIPYDMHDIALPPIARLNPGGNADGGLGLPIIHDIVQRHRGRLTFHHNQPTGLCVRIALPLDPYGSMVSIS